MQMLQLVPCGTGLSLLAPAAGLGVQQLLPSRSVDTGKTEPPFTLFKKVLLQQHLRILLTT